MTQLLKIGVMPVITPLLAQVANLSQDPAESAKVHFDAGKGYYESKKYDKALEEFQEAYDIIKSANILVNIGLCYQKVGGYKEAITAFKNYLRWKPYALDRKEIEGWIRELEKKQKEKEIKQQNPKNQQPSLDTTQPIVGFASLNPPPAKTSTDGYIPPPEEGHPIDIGTSKSNEGSLLTYKNLMWTSVGLGVAGLVTALVAHIVTKQKEEEHSSAVGDLESRGEIVNGRFASKQAQDTYSPSLNESSDDVHQGEKIVYGGLISGAVFFGLGGLFYLLDRNHTTITAQSNSQGGRVNLEVSF